MRLCPDCRDLPTDDEVPDPGNGGALRVFTMHEHVEREPCRQTRADSDIVALK
jgi:hypothetical protein